MIPALALWVGNGLAAKGRMYLTNHTGSTPLLVHGDWFAQFMG